MTVDLRDQLQKTLGDTLVLEQELGGGGMSRVFVAHESALGRKVVVKVLPPEMAAAVSIDRFRREIQLAAQLQHPHIVPLLSAGETEGLPFFTMPYVRGESLRARLKSGELPVSETIRVLREVASALAYAHENHIVHRDIKPENVLISGGSAVVTDFGVAKALTASSGAAESGLTSLGVALGTPAYMSPEQATADPQIDHRADIYALGVMAYEMLTGSTPFQGRSPQATLAAHVTEAPELITKRRPAVSPQLAALVMKCLEKHAADRPQTATHIMHELDALVTPSGGMTPTMTIPAASASTRSLRIPAIAAGVVALIVVGFLGARQIPRGSAPAEAIVKPAIAVLPFENVGRVEGRDFTDGITEEITNRLSSLTGLRVIGRQSARTYAGSDKSPKQIASELGVKYLLTGTVRWDKSADGKDVVRISPALLNSEDASQVWGDAYQTVMSGVFEVQSKVATEVANALNVRLLAPEKASLVEKPTDNPDAYAAYIRGTDIIEASIDVEAISEAISLLTRATQLDPQFSQAWARLAHAHTEYFWFNGDRTAARLKIAKDAIDKSLKLDPDLPEGHFALANWYYHGYRSYVKALAELAIVERARPNDFLAQFYKGAIQRRMGEWDASIKSMQRATELEPRKPELMSDMASTLRFLRRFPESTAFVDRALLMEKNLSDGHAMKVGMAVDVHGDVDEALATLKNARAQLDKNLGDVLLLLYPWIAAKDPVLRQRVVDQTYNSAYGRKSYYMFLKMSAFRYLGDSVRTHAYADSAAVLMTAQVKDPAEDGTTFETLAIVEAVRGRREAALKAIGTAATMLPPQIDAYESPNVTSSRVSMNIILGDHDAAISDMERLLSGPAYFTRNTFRLDPLYAPLRSNPRYQKLMRE